mgnify:CR=1 FL=1
MFDTPQQALTIWRKLKPHLLLIVSLVLITFGLRIINLLIWPIFADEAIYIRWAQVMRAEPTLRFLPLTDGKQPLFMWLIIPFLKLISNPLYAGRLVSIFAGTSSVIGLYILTYLLTKRRLTSLITGLLYAIIPYTLFFDRYALADSLLLMFGIWSLVFTYLIAKYTRLDTALISGGVLGLALLTKSPAIVFIFLGVMAPLLLPRFNCWHYLKFAILLSLTLVIAYAIYNVLRLGPEFHQISLRNQDYRFPFSEIIANPIGIFQTNASAFVSFIWYLITPGVLIFSSLGIFFLFRTKKTKVLFFLLWIVGPSIIQIFVARGLTARYFFFIVPPFLILASIGFTQVFYHYRKNLFLKLLFLIILFGYGLHQSIIIITNPDQANLPRIERSGYLEEWTAGQGLDQIASYIDRQSHSNRIVVGTEGFFGTTPDGLQIYFDKRPNVTVIGHSFIIDQVPQSLLDATQENLVYLVFNDERLKIKDIQSSNLVLVQSFPKATRPDGTHQSLMLYQVTRP